MRSPVDKVPVSFIVAESPRRVVVRARCYTPRRFTRHGVRPAIPGDPARPASRLGPGCRRPRPWRSRAWRCWWRDSEGSACTCSATACRSRPARASWWRRSSSCWSVTPSGVITRSTSARGEASPDGGPRTACAPSCRCGRRRDWPCCSSGSWPWGRSVTGTAARPSGCTRTSSWTCRPATTRAGISASPSTGTSGIPRASASRTSPSCRRCPC